MRERLAAFWKGYAEELLTLGGLVLVTIAVWPYVGRLALAIPGSALIWIALPPRRRFIERPTPPAVPSRRKS
jgi:hypothetical protein